MEAPNTIDFAKRTEQYIRLRDKIAEIKKRHSEELAPYHEAQRMLEEMLLAFLNATNQDSAAVRDVGTVFRAERVSATLADAGAFRDQIIASADWDMVDWRPNKTAVKAFVAEHGHAPLGVNFSIAYDVNVRRK